MDEAKAQRVLHNYAEIAHASYRDALTTARGLDEAVRALTEAPSESTLARAKQAWIFARIPYVQTETFRFYDGPIDEVEPWLNSWPIDENLVDLGENVVVAKLRAEAPSIVGDVVRHPHLSEELLLAWNEQPSETSITTGYHVIEFLLWGPDTDADGPGARSFTDYVIGPNAPLAARRAEYLRLTTRLLIRHLAHVTDAWKPDVPSNYRAQFTSWPVREALAKVFKGMGVLSGVELAGERLTVAYETKEQENEHSCFSDTSSADAFGNALGVENLCLGQYRAVDGTLREGEGVCALVEAADAALGRRLRSEIRASVRAARAIPSPFDQAFLGSDERPGRKAIRATIRALAAQSDTLARSAQRLGLDLGLSLARGAKP